jgi:L-amino acid N-acyltransferase YncA
MTQYNAILSAAAAPLEQRLADSQPNPVTQSLLKEALSSPSANAYFALVASTKAKASATMSAREFEAFEVGRRYANTAYQTDLQAMAGDNLMRELIRVATLGNWLTLALKNEVQKGNMINGMTLASLARQEYEPILAQKSRSIPGRAGQ